MSLTTVAVSVFAARATGQTLANGRVRLMLTNSDVDGTVIAPTPIDATLDATGFVLINLWPNARGTQGSQYTAYFYDANGKHALDLVVSIPASSCNLHDCIQPLVTTSGTTALAASTGSSLIGFTQSGSPAAGTLAAKLQQIVSVKDAPYNAKGDGVTDDTAAILLAVATASALYFPQGTYITAPFSHTAGVYGDGTEKTIIKAKAASTGYLLSIKSTSGQYSTVVRDLQLLANGSGQSGLVMDQATGTIERVRTQNFDTVGIALGLLSANSGAFWCRVAECFVVMSAGTGVLLEGGSAAANANEVQNVYVSGNFTTGIDIRGNANRITGGTMEWRAGCVDVHKISGNGNYIDNAYTEQVGGAMPTTLFNVTGNGNQVRNLWLQASLSNSLYAFITDTGMNNRFEIGKNLRFSTLSKQSKKNYIPNKRFNVWAGANQPYGYTNIGAGASKDASTTFLGSSSLHMAISGNFLQAQCYLLPNGNSLTNYPAQAFQGKTVSISAACKTSLAGYGGLTYTILAPSGNINGDSQCTHTGSGNWEIFSDQFLVPSDATQIIFTMRSHRTNTVGTGDVWFASPSVVIGGEGAPLADILQPSEESTRTEDVFFMKDATSDASSALLSLHGRYMWSDPLGALRQSGTRPTAMATDGNALGRKVTVPATAVTAGVPGDWAADTSNFYAYTGDGTTHTWRRVAVAAW